jgi:thiol-disulfide isomerase/thioredoxin
MPAPSRSFWESRWLYPVAAVLVIGAIVGLGRCPGVRTSARDFTLPVVSSTGTPGPDRVHLADLRGKVVLVDFWATWCGPCQYTTPALVRLSHRFQSRGLKVVGVDVDQDGPGLVPLFAQRFGVDYPLVYDDGQVSEQYNIRGLPTVVLIDRQGRIAHVHTGAATEDDLADLIEGLL